MPLDDQPSDLAFIVLVRQGGRVRRHVGLRLQKRQRRIVRAVVDEEEVLDFGKRYVPLPYHIDKEAAKKSIYGGLIASGWHTAAIMMRLYTENYLSKVANLGSPGCDEMRWDKPVFPGDQLSVRAR